MIYLFLFVYCIVWALQMMEFFLLVAVMHDHVTFFIFAKCIIYFSAVSKNLRIYFE